MNNKIELGAQCTKCGQWNAVTTTNISCCSFLCKKCGAFKKIRGSKGWNVNYRIPRENESLSDLIQRLNLT